MIYIIPMLLLFLVILSHNLAKAVKEDQKKMVEELTEILDLTEWQIRVLREYLRG